MSTTVTLESAISAFDHWRDTRTSHKAAIPDHLRETIRTIRSVDQPLTIRTIRGQLVLPLFDI